MSEITDILQQLQGTEEYSFLTEIEQIYQHIYNEQAIWYQKTNFVCPGGCGCCCEHFEPDLLPCEALYMAAWIIQHNPEMANDVANGIYPYDEPTRCPFYNPNSPYHCSIYGGRGLICRLFGASCAKTKTNIDCWRPCHFYPANRLATHQPPIEHRQYEGEEILQLFGMYPPIMSDMTSQALNILPNKNNAQLIREILPAAIQKLLLILQFVNESKDTE